MYRFGALFHDWPESYFKAQASRGDNLADIFKQAMGAAKATKVTRQKSILARMFPGARLASLLGSQVRPSNCCYYAAYSSYLIFASV